MPRSKYKYIAWRSHANQDGKPWQAVVQGKYLGCFTKEEEAAEAVAKKLRQPKASLLHSHHGSAPMRTPRRTHRYVYWHRRDQLWQVKIGHTFWGSFVDHEVALAMAVEKVGISKEELQLHPHDVRKSLQGKRHAVLQHAHWFRHLYRAYSGPDGPAYPGDLSDMHHRAHSDSEILTHPNFIVPMLLAKFGPHRDALQDAFTESCPPSLEDNAVIAEWTYNVLVDALIRLSTIPDEKMGPWIAGGKQTMFHSGLVVYANCSLKILAACEQQPTCMKRKIHTTNTLVFGKQQRSFLIMPYSTAIQRTLMKVRSFGEALLEVEPPKSLEEWSMAMKSMQKRMKNAPGIPNPRCYRYKWVTRSFWDFRLRQQGILPGISYSKASKVPAGNMAMHDHSLARALVSNAI